MTKLQHISWMAILLILSSSSIDIAHGITIARETESTAISIAGEQPLQQQENN